MKDVAAARCLMLCSFLLPGGITAVAQQTHGAMSTADTASLRSALDAYDAGHFDIAQPALQILALRYPNSFEANEALGSLYVEAGHSNQALPLLEHAARLAPHDALALSNLGAAYLKQARYTDALRTLQRSAATDPRNAATQTNLGHAQMAVGSKDAAIESFRHALSLTPGDPVRTFDLASALKEDGLVTEAANLLATVPEATMSPELHTLAAEIDEQAGRFTEALQHYQLAAHSDPSDANIYALAAELLRHWNWAEAIEVAQYGEQRYPDSKHFELAVGVGHYGNNDYAAATTVFARLLQADPDNSMLADLLGRGCAALPDDQEGACDGVLSFVERHPGNAVMMTYAANAILHQPLEKRDLTKVAQLLQGAITAAPTYAEAWLRLGILDQVEAKWAESAAAIEKSIELRPKQAEAHYRLSRAYAHLGRRDDAQREIALNQQYSKEAKQSLDASMQEVMLFNLTPR